MKDVITACSQILRTAKEETIKTYGNIRSGRQRMAHWIASTEFNYMSGLRETHYKCSECKKYLKKEYRTPNPDKCPNCGADMRDKENKND